MVWEGRRALCMFSGAIELVGRSTSEELDPMSSLLFDLSKPLKVFWPVGLMMTMSSSSSSMRASVRMRSTHCWASCSDVALRW